MGGRSHRMVTQMFTDSHCHLASHKFDETEIQDLISRSEESGIHRLITLSTDIHDLLPNLKLAEKHEQVYTCLGIHPTEVTNVDDNACDEIVPHLTKSKVVAVGETGLDYYHPAPEGWSEENYHSRQREFLEKHFQIAAASNLNIVLHTRDKNGTASFDDCISIYKKYASDVKAVFHCFPSTVAQAEEVFKLGGLISFTGNVTFKNAKLIQETATMVPLHSFMLETDSPYLAPVPVRGNRNEPAYILHIAEYICKLRGIPPEKLSEATETNVNSFFRF